jgi:hypothetical protein
VPSFGLSVLPSGVLRWSHPSSTAGLAAIARAMFGVTPNAARIRSSSSFAVPVAGPPVRRDISTLLVIGTRDPRRRVSSKHVVGARPQRPLSNAQATVTPPRGRARRGHAAGRAPRRLHRTDRRVTERLGEAALEERVVVDPPPETVKHGGRDAGNRCTKVPVVPRAYSTHEASKVLTPRSCRRSAQPSKSHRSCSRRGRARTGARATR